MSINFCFALSATYSIFVNMLFVTVIYSEAARRLVLFYFLFHLFIHLFFFFFCFPVCLSSCFYLCVSICFCLHLYLSRSLSLSVCLSVFLFFFFFFFFVFFFFFFLLAIPIGDALWDCGRSFFFLFLFSATILSGLYLWNRYSQRLQFQCASWSCSLILHCCLPSNSLRYFFSKIFSFFSPRDMARTKSLQEKKNK